MKIHLITSPNALTIATGHAIANKEVSMDIDSVTCESCLITVIKTQVSQLLGIERTSVTRGTNPKNRMNPKWDMVPMSSHVQQIGSAKLKYAKIVSFRNVGKFWTGYNYNLQSELWLMQPAQFAVGLSTKGKYHDSHMRSLVSVVYAADYVHAFLKSLPEYSKLINSRSYKTEVVIDGDSQYCVIKTPLGVNYGFILTWFITRLANLIAGRPELSSDVDSAELSLVYTQSTQTDNWHAKSILRALFSGQAKGIKFEDINPENYTLSLLMPWQVGRLQGGRKIKWESNFKELKAPNLNYVYRRLDRGSSDVHLLE